MSTPIISKVEDLEKAKANVRTCLDHPDASVDFHSLTYWAGRVETLRQEIRESL